MGGRGEGGRTEREGGGWMEGDGRVSVLREEKWEGDGEEEDVWVMVLVGEEEGGEEEGGLTKRDGRARVGTTLAVSTSSSRHSPLRRSPFKSPISGKKLGRKR